MANPIGRRGPSSFALGALLLLGACDPNQFGNLAAETMGDASRPMTGGSPVEALRAACGEGDLTTIGAGVIHRRPYLQQVTTSSAMLGWVTTETRDERVVVTTTDGWPVTAATALHQPGDQRAAGERQMWATINGLEPDTTYCYSVLGDSTLTRRTGFRTAPAADSERTIRFMTFGDSGGGGDDQLALRDQMFGFPYDLIVHTGDLAYDDGTIDQIEATVFGVYRELFQNLPFFPAAGNHDYGTLQGAPFHDVFALPGDSGEKWYSYDWGRIHFAALDTEADYATQAAWLDEDLAASDAPWKIVYLHRPPYSSGHHGSDGTLRRLIAPVVERHGVQLLLAGHDHHYERTTAQNGVVYVVTGGGGRGTYSVGSSSFTAFSEDVIHFVVVEVGMDELVLHAIDGTGVEFDSTVVARAGA